MPPLLSCVDLGCSPVSWAGAVVLGLNHRFQTECEQPASPACEGCGLAGLSPAQRVPYVFSCCVHASFVECNSEGSLLLSLTDSCTRT